MSARLRSPIASISAKTVNLTYTHKKQSGGSGQFGEVKRRGEARRAWLRAFLFFDEIKGGNIPREYIPSVEKGFRETALTGSLIGFPIIDFEVHLIDGKYHDVDSSALAFEICARGAMREAAQKAGHQAARADHEGRGRHPGRLSGRRHRRHELAARGQIQGTDSRGNAQTVEAHGAPGQHVRLCEPAAQRSRRAARAIRCSSRTMTRCRRMWRTR